MSWRIYATAQVADAHATLYQIPGGGLNLRVKSGDELLLDGFYASVQEAVLEAALSGLPQPLYDAFLDAVARRGRGRTARLTLRSRSCRFSALSAPVSAAARSRRPPWR